MQVFPSEEHTEHRAQNWNVKRKSPETNLRIFILTTKNFSNLGVCKRWMIERKTNLKQGADEHVRRGQPLEGHSSFGVVAT